MKKKMKIKDIRCILFPSIACTTAAVFGIPVLCEISSGHLSMDYAHQRWAKIEEWSQTEFQYKFILDEEIQPNQKVIITLENSPFYKDATCKGMIEGEATVEEGSKTRILQTIKLQRNDGEHLQYFDAAFFNLKFALIWDDTKEIIWTDEIEALRLRFEAHKPGELYERSSNV